ncbi:EAL domain-containing protein [Hyphomicrobium sp.]|uniref:EAL domain-containing protein n=1 Tax=Hyphomicrobium sp. TaxID=82 RepID=UPI0025BEC656|nr:EAL domain-containing protein [Hyphomicrobium sp.]MCC7250716.1 EAL domain-containing protein [Hyphomicrobium sp.]
MTRNQTASQTIVVVAMGLVAGASAVALHQHAGMPGPVAATAALSAYLLLLTLHAFLWRKGRSALEPARPRDVRANGLRRPQDAAHRVPPAMPMPPSGPLSKAPLPHGPGNQAPLPQGVRPNAPPPPAPPPFEAKTRAPIGATGMPAGGPPMPAAGPMPPAPPAPPQAQRQAERAGPPPLPASPPPAAAPMADDLQDLWSFRPSASGQKLPPFVTGRAPGQPVEPTLPGPATGRGPASAAPARPAAPQPRAGAPREADVEVIQDAIKRLLEEVNAAEQTRSQAQGAPRSAPAGTPPPPQAAPAPSSPDASIERSIEALRMTAGTMRAARGAGEAAPVAAGAPQPPPLPPFVRPAQPRATSPADARARLMADAISAGRIDVALEPILGLEDQQTRHYEVSVRLRDADGNPLDVTPDGPDLRGTGLLPLFDGVRVARTAAVARRLEDRGKNGSVFSAFSGESVADEHFLGELAETLHLRASLASQLVLSFTQGDVRGFSTPEWDSLADMRALGFRFAISHMTDLDMDFEALADQGFVFAKLDASVFLDGLRAPSGHLPSSDVCRHLAKHGLTLVVEHIDDDELLARVFGFGVLLGQGQLFGGARPVRAEVVNDRARGTGSTAGARATA